MKELNKGDKVELEIGEYATIIDKIGEGGQGFVYKVEMGGNLFALKWYNHDCTDEFYKNMSDNIIKGAPSEIFLWPLHITKWSEKRFGYLMNLRPKEYLDFSDFLLAKVQFSSINAMLNAALCICNGFRELHRHGYSYQDLNDGNFFIDKQTGDILICDNDNVAPYGTNLGITGKCRYMAPEVVLGKNKPDSQSDKFSLSVTLFLLLFNNHPLEGKKNCSVPCMTENYEKKFYGLDPIFIYDPLKEDNRPVRGIHSNIINRWGLFPKYIQKAFEKAFCEEVLQNPDHRITENEWIKLFVRLRNNLVICHHCGNETFLNSDIQKSNCISCGKQVNVFVGEIDGVNIGLTTSNKIYNCHTKKNNADFKNISGEVIKNKKNPLITGIKNLSTETWQYKTPNGEKHIVPSGNVIPLLEGVKIRFADGTICSILKS